MIDLRHPTSRWFRWTIPTLFLLLPAAVAVARAAEEPPPEEPASAEAREPQGEEGGETGEEEERPAIDPERFSWAVVSPQPQRQWVGEPISLSLKNADLVETLRSFAKMTGANLIIDPGVKGSVTVELKDVPWDQALHSILKINGLGMEISGNVWSLKPAERLRVDD